MAEIFHTSPERVSSEAESKKHRLDLFVEGQHIGLAELVYMNKPFPFYYVSDLDIDDDSAGKGYGRELVHQVNQFLDDKGKAGIVLDAIAYNSPAHGMYGRNGWTAIDNEFEWYIYNPPKDISPERLSRAVNYARTNALET